jgi:hypothetical protein
MRSAARFLLALGVAALLGLASARARGLDEACTHLAFVVDTSEAMRDAKTGRLLPAIFQSMLTALASHPEVRGVQLFDAEGNRMIVSPSAWEACAPETLLAMERVLGRYSTNTVPNPLPGIARALRQSPGEKEPGARLHVCVIGETYVPGSESVLCRLDELNPAAASGGRAAVISVLQVTPAPSSSRAPRLGSDATFRTLMSEVAQQHGGTFRRVGGGL